MTPSSLPPGTDPADAGALQLRSSSPLGEQRRRTDLERALTVAKWTDARFLDPLVGLLLPGVGDVLGAAAGLYIVAMAVRHGAPRTVVARMLFNLSLDCLGGVVPVVGDVFDLLNRANLRNARLLEQHIGGAPGAGRSLALPVAVLAAAVAVALAVTFVIAHYWWH